MSDREEQHQLGFGDLEARAPEPEDEPALPDDELDEIEADLDPTPEEDFEPLEPLPPVPARLERRTALPARRPFDTDAAPVVTDEGVYGTLPPPRRRLSDFEEPETNRRASWARGLGVLFSLLAAAWLVLFSVAQATSETVALPAITRTVEALTGLERVLAIHEQAIRESRDDPVTVPGYSVTGVSLARSEVTPDSSPADWHALLLDRTARAVYTSGPEVLSVDGTQSDGGAFSTSGGALMLMGTLSESRHSLASSLLLPLGVAAGLALAGAMILGSPFGRFQITGFGLAVASLPAIGLWLLLWGLLTFIGSDGSHLADETSSIASELKGIPLRNGLTVLLAGLAIVIPARVAGAIFARSTRREPLSEG